MIKRIIKKIIPNPFLLFYHKTLAVLASIIYWFPSRKMTVIGVTGTKGKSSTCVMITSILEEAGYAVGSTNTVFFKIADRQWPNATKQGMPGRLKMQKTLRQMVREKCTHAVIEVTSEGILQHRQWGIDFNVAVFTNLSPEHISSHGSFSNYKKAKEEIFKKLRPRQGESAIVVNGDDDHAKSFLSHRAKQKWAVCADALQGNCLGQNYNYLRAKRINPSKNGTVLQVADRYIHINLKGSFMAHNALLAIAACRAVGISFSACEAGLEKIDSIPGRSEVVTGGAGRNIIIDYAHEPKSFQAIFDLARQYKGGKSKIIAVFGATGGGRDKEKRPKMGQIAAKYADEIILTTDDAYDDDPRDIARDVLRGIPKKYNARIIIDRKDAIRKAFEDAKSGDFILILGKGSEKTMAVANNKYIPWSDKEAVQDILRNSG